mmetsp:Transcript_45324/g.145327  ORF Transcript_45324/g.145327 Transcript_45324/m.145327 type:complete len:251 (+) Transcript_45324:860-1612(+)
MHVLVQRIDVRGAQISAASVRVTCDDKAHRQVLAVHEAMGAGLLRVHSQLERRVGQQGDGEASEWAQQGHIRLRPPPQRAALTVAAAVAIGLKGVADLFGVDGLCRCTAEVVPACRDAVGHLVWKLALIVPTEVEAAPMLACRQGLLGQVHLELLLLLRPLLLRQLQPVQRRGHRKVTGHAAGRPHKRELRRECRHVPPACSCEDAANLAQASICGVDRAGSSVCEPWRRRYTSHGLDHKWILRTCGRVA